MAYTEPQAAPTVATGAGTSLSKAYTSNVTAHSILIAYATTDKASPTFTFSSTGATWATANQKLESVSGQNVAIGYCLDAPAGATTVSVSFGGSGTFNGLIIAEYAAPGGVASVLNVKTAGTTGNSSTPTDASLAASSGDLVVAAGMANGPTFTAGSGFTIVKADTSNGGALERLLSATGTLSPSFTLSASSTWAIVSAAFSPSGGGGGPTPTPDVIMAPLALQYRY